MFWLQKQTRECFPKLSAISLMFIKSHYLDLKSHLAFVTWGFKISRACLCWGYGGGSSREVSVCVWYVTWPMCSSMWNNNNIVVQWGRWGAQQWWSVTLRDCVLALFYPLTPQLTGLSPHSCCCLSHSKRAGELCRIWTCWTTQLLNKETYVGKGIYTSTYSLTD